MAFGVPVPRIAEVHGLRLVAPKGVCEIQEWDSDR
jgi:hypothetical protein